MLLDIVYVVVGFVMLIFGANWLVDGASDIAKKMGISPLTIGLTVVALGTSAPELAINIISSSSANTEIALGNIIGSNIFNIFLILGVSALVKPLIVDKSTIKVDIPFNLLAGVILFFMANDMMFDGASSSILSCSDGIILILLFSVFMYYNFLNAKNGVVADEESKVTRKVWLMLLMVIGGLALLVVGAKAIVTGAVSIAENFGISKAVIGLTIVAAGTSLPELATSVIAAYKNEPDIAIGNVVGSCIFNVLFVLGISSVIVPIQIYPAANFDLLMNVAACLLLLVLSVAGGNKEIKRREGIIMTLIFVGYTCYLISIAK